MKVALLKARYITNLHIGASGNVYGDIKCEVEKDAVLATPIMPSSGIKGALRDFWKVNGTIEDSVTIFGSDAEEENKNRKGNCKFLSGQLLFRPMRVSKGERAYCLVTTPELLQVMINTIDSFHIKLKLQSEKSTEVLKKALNEIKKELNENNGQVMAGIINKDDDAIMEVEGYVVKEIQVKENDLYKVLLEISEGVPVAIMKTEFFQMIDLPIIARNYLKDGKSTNLWYEEFVPHQSYFYFPVLWEKEEREVFVKFIREISKQPIAFGGNNSIGYGYCTVTPMNREWEDNDGE